MATARQRFGAGFDAGSGWAATAPQLCELMDWLMPVDASRPKANSADPARPSAANDTSARRRATKPRAERR